MIIEIFYMFLENKNCFLLFYYNEKKISGIEVNIVRDGGCMCCILFG